MTRSDPGLFPEPTGPAPMRTAMLSNLDSWAASGQVIGAVTRAALLAQADAVDLALNAHRPTAVSGATRVLLELLQGFHLVIEVPAEADAKLTEFLTKIEQAANGDG